MLGRWMFIGVVALGVFAYMHAHHSAASRADVTQACAASDAPAAAGDQENNGSLEHGNVVATIAWTATTNVEQTSLDVGVTKDFRDGLTTSHGPLPAPATSFTLEGLLPDVTHFYRVKVLRDGAWDTIASGSFVAGCPPATATAR